MSENPIDARAMVAKVWNKKWQLLCTWLCVAVAAYGLTYLQTPKYEADTEFVPEYNLQEWRTLQQIVWDMNVESHIHPAGTVLSPKVYSAIMEGREYIDELGTRRITTGKGDTTTIADYYTEMTHAEDAARYYEAMQQLVICDITRRQSTVTITATAADAKVAAQVSTIARELLSEYVERNLTGVRRRNLAYYETLRDENELARTMYELAELDLKQHQPIFTILRESIEPYKPVSPRRIVTSLMALLIAMMASLIWVWRKDIPDWF